MALMPEDLETKRFTPVRFTEGYDMDEVDNYLDHDVIPRIKQLLDENERLQRELDEAHNRIAELEQGGGEPATVAAAPVADTQDEAVGFADTQEAAPQHTSGATADAAGLIALAQRLHDEHVANGEAERDRLISEAQSEHERIITEANDTSRTTLEKLESEKAQLEKEIEGLRTFERDYRSRLRNYLENQLRDLDTSEPQEKSGNYGL